MSKFIIEISYDGSKFEGLQKLKKGRTIQGELEKVLEKLEKKPVQVISAGRTDKGVHAIGQVCSFNLERDITPYKLKGYLNRSTSPYLYIKNCQISKDENFHARFSVKSKTYIYKILTSEYDPIKKDYIYNYNKYIDINLMKKASQYLIGQHDFKAFIIGQHDKYTTTIENIDISKKSNIISIRIKGEHFYTYMIRNIVEVLVLIGANKVKPEIIKNMLQEKRKLIEYSPAPSGGLYLERVEYYDKDEKFNGDFASDVIDTD